MGLPPSSFSKKKSKTFVPWCWLSSKQCSRYFLNILSAALCSQYGLPCLLWGRLQPVTLVKHLYKYSFYEETNLTSVCATFVHTFYTSSRQKEDNLFWWHKLDDTIFLLSRSPCCATGPPFQATTVALQTQQMALLKRLTIIGR